MTDFADREATSIISLVRSLGHSPDLHGIVAAKLRGIRHDGLVGGQAIASVIVDMAVGTDRTKGNSQ